MAWHGQVVFGGTNIKTDISRARQKTPTFLIATPGALYIQSSASLRRPPPASHLKAVGAGYRLCTRITPGPPDAVSLYGGGRSTTGSIPAAPAHARRRLTPCHVRENPLRESDVPAQSAPPAVHGSVLLVFPHIPPEHPLLPPLPVVLNPWEPNRNFESCRDCERPKGLAIASRRAIAFGIATFETRATGVKHSAPRSFMGRP